MSAQYSTHTEAGPPRERFAMFPEKALQSPEGKAIKHRLIRMTVPPLHQFTFLFTFL